MASRGAASWPMAAGVGVVTLKVVASVPQLPGQTAVVAITWLVTVTFVVVGVMLLATDVPPANGWGCILAAASTVPGDLNDPHYAHAGLSVVGFVLEPLYLAAVSALVLRYPRRQLSRAERSLMTVLLASGFISRLLAIVTSGPLPDDSFRPPGWATVPLPTVWHDEVFVRGGRGLQALLLLVVGVLLARRLARAHGLSRQSQIPLVLVGLVCAVAAAADQLVWVSASPALRDLPAALLRNLSAAFLPVALLGDLLRRRSAGAAVSRQILTAAITDDMAALQAAVRDVFADRTAVIEMPDGRGGWVDLAGAPVAPAAAPGGRRHEDVVLDDGSVLLRVGLDDRAVHDETLVAAALAAMQVGAHNTRLRTELLVALSELGDSRTRIVEASLAERRRLERDLHDGAQQQFLTVAATLAQTDLVDDTRVREIVTYAQAVLGDALAELRSLARGIHPAALSQGGLPAALPAVAERMPFPVAIRIG
ncbi:MAG: histidine kinase, partial [Lapillicoccus sp.]